jgi:hypothetical protein
MPDIANVIAGILMKVPGIADAPSVMAAAAKVGGRSQRQPLRDKFFVQPTNRTSGANGRIVIVPT